MILLEQQFKDRFINVFRATSEKEGSQQNKNTSYSSLFNAK